jgi:hypothetical protein
VTAEELRKAEARYQRAFARAEEAREERNRLVREAAADGWTDARIAEALGVSRTRAGKLAERRTA